MNTTAATTTYEVEAGLPKGIHIIKHSWDCDTRNEAVNLANDLVRSNLGWQSVCIFEVTTREITR